MLLKKLIFETNDSLKFDIINIENSDEDSYEITFGDNEIIDSSEVFGQLVDLFNIAKIRIMSNEKPFEVAISDDGTVLGGSVNLYRYPFCIRSLTVIVLEDIQTMYYSVVTPSNSASFATASALVARTIPSL